MTTDDLTRLIRGSTNTLWHNALCVADNVHKGKVYQRNIDNTREWMRKLEELLTEAEQLQAQDKE